ncbi:hypothetical protein PHYPSEUDO_004314 [Phytophthora pseudosyringae]|uniref:Uncharacterized protein n=1 Tax=Phytophthora pseudosyringae TaxID=221518 RepID=A0A8T1VPE9_9STRA|nr:hypothetical protein PHYPSEUDO_004314 [Phytophthora pseudosyringae]
MSPTEIAALVEKKLSKAMQLKLVSYDETKKNYEKDPVAYILTPTADERCVSEEAEATVAKKLPRLEPDALRDVQLRKALLTRELFLGNVQLTTLARWSS